MNWSALLALCACSVKFFIIFKNNRQQPCSQIIHPLNCLWPQDDVTSQEEYLTYPLHLRPGPVFYQCFYLRPQNRCGIRLFIGFRSDTLGALEQVLSPVFAQGLMGICLETPPELQQSSFRICKVTTCAALKSNCIYSMNILKLLNNWKQFDFISWRQTLSVKSHLSNKIAERRLLTREGGKHWMICISTAVIHVSSNI